MLSEQAEGWRGPDGAFCAVRWAEWAEDRGLLPWQQTRAQFTKRPGDEKPIDVRYGAPGTVSTLAIAALEVERLNLKATQMQAHRRSVEQAIGRGKPVPQEVLADYPDIILGSG